MMQDSVPSEKMGRGAMQPNGLDTEGVHVL